MTSNALLDEPGLANPWRDEPPKSATRPDITAIRRTFKVKHALTFTSAFGPNTYPYGPTGPTPEDRSLISFFEYRGIGPPPKDFGFPGDVYISVDPNCYGLWAMSEHKDREGLIQWHKWTPTRMVNASTSQTPVRDASDKWIEHPHLPGRFLWCSVKSARISWYTEGTLENMIRQNPSNSSRASEFVAQMLEAETGKKKSIYAAGAKGKSTEIGGSSKRRFPSVSTDSTDLLSGGETEKKRRRHSRDAEGSSAELESFTSQKRRLSSISTYSSSRPPSHMSELSNKSCDPSNNPPHSPDARPSRLGYVDDQDLTEPTRHCIGPRVKLKNELKRAREERNKFAKRNKQLTSEVAQLRKINDECDASRNIMEQVSMQRKEMCETLTEEIRRLKTSQASLTCEKRTLLERIKITEERSRVLSEKNATLEEETANLAEEKVKLVEENSELMWNAELQADRMGHENTQAHFGHLANDSSLQLSGSSDTVKSALEMHLSCVLSIFEENRKSREETERILDEMKRRHHLDLSDAVREKEEVQSKLAALERTYAEVMKRQEAMRRLLT